MNHLAAWRPLANSFKRRAARNQVREQREHQAQGRPQGPVKFRPLISKRRSGIQLRVNTLRLHLSRHSVELAPSGPRGLEPTAPPGSLSPDPAVTCHGPEPTPSQTKDACSQSILTVFFSDFIMSGFHFCSPKKTKKSHLAPKYNTMLNDVPSAERVGICPLFPGRDQGPGWGQARPPGQAA